MSTNRSWKDRLSSGLAKSRERLGGQLNTLMGRVVEIDDDFYEDLEETLISADFGFESTMDIVEKLREQVAVRAVGDMDGVRELLIEIIAGEFETSGDPFQFSPVTILMVGINGTGKTTSTGKLAKQAVDEGRSVILGSADTFRAAAAEQLDIWAERANVDIVRRDRGTDPASVSYATVEAAQEMGADLALIDTAGRLHTSPDLMRELEKVQRVTREKSIAPTFTVLVIDATTGQNGLVQAREFNKLLSVDALILTKLDGTAKGGIAVSIARELKVPIVRIGVGESIEDLRPFNPREFAEALIGP
ncbi:MAG: signal recognition particle-docking protein FtsY [Coriobacteriia bacterium]|nr:signal recognition particle-docking protein FtsY [Coriobacteriia bacterium]